MDGRERESEERWKTMRRRGREREERMGERRIQRRRELGQWTGL